ncbi:hypothetical protein [Brachybacterium sp. UMB0905]|uniref:hypothetical protein n=1 Tax=Brachybacterium sp. UMB0905 TaxID=2069310 RepID=UPI001E427D00|nr:hypothetical protein [Brachybacterium sp. UMB0905]
MTAAALAALPVGAEYRSTDGADVGAWVWSKRPTGWVVTDGDTGWRIIPLTDAGFSSGRLRLRRTPGLVWVSADDLRTDGTATDVRLIPRSLGRKWDVDGDNVTYPGSMFAMSTGNFVRLDTGNLRVNPPANARLRDLRAYPNSKPWPMTLPGTPA